jgi:hypothetical protein
MTDKTGDSTVGTALGLYGRLFRNPAAIVFLLIFLLIYTMISLAVISPDPINFLELVKAVPFAVSALVLGIFSVLFWALNYVGRTQKSELKCKEVERLFEIRRNAIDEIFSNSSIEDTEELATLKAHLLLANGEINWEPEAPSTSLAFDYGEAVKAILRRS